VEARPTERKKKKELDDRGGFVPSSKENRSDASLLLMPKEREYGESGLAPLTREGIELTGDGKGGKRKTDDGFSV